MEEKTKITIHFYKVKIEVSEQLSLFHEESNAARSLNNYTNCLRSVAKEGIFVLQEHKKHIHFIDENEHFLFGDISKSEEIKKQGIMKRITSPEIGLENNIKLLLDTFKYFLFDFESFVVAVVENSEAPNFKSSFGKFLEHCTTPSIKSVGIYPLLQDTMRSHLNGWDNLETVTLQFTPSEIPLDILSLEDCFNISNNDILETTIRIKFKNKTTPKIKVLDKLLKNSGLYSFSKLKAQRKTEAGDSEIVELMEKKFIRRRDLNIKKEDLESDNYNQIIRDTLLQEIKQLV